MTNRLRATAVFWGVVGLGCAAAATGAAWGCVPQARLVSVRPMSSGAPGTTVEVEALAFDEGRAEVRWNTPDGERLAEALGPTFTAQVTIPEVPPGLYGIVVVSRGADGALGNAGRAAFEVTAPEGAGPAPGATVARRAPGAGADEPSSTASRGDRGWLALAAVALVVGGSAIGYVVARRRLGAGDAG